jgi:hypothetical protein
MSVGGKVSRRASAVAGKSLAFQGPLKFVADRKTFPFARWIAFELGNDSG